ncbi:hypothetical protein NliqN6_4626 [Naganishia liquefaciens]|uniref:Ubiquitin carboxyl-terminal hydrolase n=1 Tax=Naganishia liquefaciens TaxID=104408 RepID=A0A8H3YG17_9TREE|nr:hypothetical protein NliqN6_4626 [Naganishia liquefaciens]
MTAVAPSPLPFTTNARLVNDTASSSQRSYHKSPRRQNGAAASPISMKNFSVGKPVNGSTHQAKTGLDAYGDGIKALLADPIKFELYAKKVSTDETKYKPINPTVDSAEDLNGTDGSAQAGPSKPSFSYTANSSRDSATESASTAPNSTKDLWPRPVKVAWPAETVYERHAKGLQNLGNTCFANSILQVMMYTPPVLHYLSGQGHDFSSCTLASKGFCFTCELQKARRNLWTSSGQSWSPKEIMRSIKKICPSMRQFRQEDAHEFFRYGIDLLHNEALKLAKATKEPHAVRETSWIHKVWGGRLRSRITCHDCGNNSDTFDAFLDLSLDLDNKTATVKDALAKFVQKDSLSGKNKYKCEKCNKLVDATKQMQIVKAPEVLSLHLKRFTPTGRKITSTIKYTGNLNLDPYMDNYTGSPLYELYAVTVHQGSGPHIGHYYSYVKNKNGTWFEANDESVHVAQARVFPSAYILHYIRKAGSALDAIKAGKANAASTPRKDQSDSTRLARADREEGTPVASSSSPVKRGEKRKQSDEDEQSGRIANGIANPSNNESDERSSESEREDEDQHMRKKTKGFDKSPSQKKINAVPSSSFGYKASSVSEGSQAKQGSDRMFESRGSLPGHKNKRKKHGAKGHASPYGTGLSKREKMRPRDFRRK